MVDGILKFAIFLLFSTLLGIRMQDRGVGRSPHDDYLQASRRCFVVEVTFAKKREPEV